ncbi:hypothetical protein JTB14_004424 [Gonioctena quinquepunctata]|nr:hypothetical protein JTB14_004424 [Gonioctena quinquepunctata]
MDKRKRPSGAKFREQKKLRLQEREKMDGSLKHFLQNNQDSTETIDGLFSSIYKRIMDPKVFRTIPASNFYSKNISIREIPPYTDDSELSDDQANEEELFQ